MLAHQNWILRRKKRMCQISCRSCDFSFNSDLPGRDKKCVWDCWRRHDVKSSTIWPHEQATSHYKWNIPQSSSMLSRWESNWPREKRERITALSQQIWIIPVFSMVMIIALGFLGKAIFERLTSLIHH